MFETTKGITNPMEIVSNYTKNYVGLLDMLLDIYPTLPNSGTKNRCTRIIKKIKLTLENSSDLQNFTDSQTE